MMVAIARRDGFAGSMPERRIKELELQLAAANEIIVKLTATNDQLTRGLAEAESYNKKLRRNARRDESTFKEQLATAQIRRG
jgi:phage shock protein A